MLIQRQNARRIVWVTVLAAMPAAAAMAAEPFPLAKAVPSDVFICAAWQHTADQKFLDDAWHNVFEALHESGVLQDAWKLLAGSDATGPDADNKAMAEKLTGLLGAVNWSDICGHDGVFMERMAYPMPSFAVLFRCTAGKAEGNYAGLCALLAEAKKLGDESITLKEQEIAGAKVTTLSLAGTPLTLSIGMTGDVIVCGLREELLRDALERLAGTSKKAALVDTPRFRKAFAGLAPAKEGMFFLDGANLFNGLRKMTDEIEKELKKNTPPDPEHDAAGPAGWVGVGRALIEDAAVLDYVATTKRVQGMRVFEDCRTVLAADAKSRGMYPLFSQRQSIGQFDKYVPKEAMSFSVSQGMNLRAAYQWGRNFVMKKVPKGQEIMEQHFDTAMESLGVNVERDLLAWIGGPSIMVEMNSSNPLSGGDWVLMQKVTDEELAGKKVRAAVDKAGEMLNKAIGGIGGGGLHARPKKDGDADAAETPALSSTPIKIAGRKGFYEIRLQHPMLMMFAMQFAPVWGVCDGYLWVGSNKAAVQRCLETASGAHESIRKNTRFAAESATPEKGDGMLTAISYTDQSETATGIQAMLGAVGMVGMMTQMNPALGKLPPPVGKMLEFASSSARKLQPVAEKLNFFLSTSSCEAVSGDVTRIRTVHNYRQPPTPKKGADDDDDSWGDEGKSGKKGTSGPSHAPAEHKRGNRPKSG